MKLASRNVRIRVNNEKIQKCCSLSYLMKTNETSSSSSTDSYEEEYRKLVIIWLMNYKKNIHLSTNYISISYFKRYVSYGGSVTEYNYQHIAAIMLILACKMNQIYPLKIKKLITKMTKPISISQLVFLQAFVLKLINYELNIQSTSYQIIINLLANHQKVNDLKWQKLLALAIPQKNINQYGQHILAYAVLYLLKPELIKALQFKDLQKIKKIAGKLYNLYLEKKKIMNKENLQFH